MHPHRIRAALTRNALALGISVLACAPAGSTPLAADSAAADRTQAAGVQRLSDLELVLTDPRLDLTPEAPTASSLTQLPGTNRSRTSATAPAGFDFGQGLDSGSAPLDGSTKSVLRSVVNVQRSGGATPGVPTRGRRGPANDSLGLDLGLTSNEWIRDSVQEVLTSVLNLNVNERGQATFSFLGMGDFSVTASADRSEIALTAGDNVLITGHRSGASALGAGTAQGGRHPDPGWSFGGTPSGGAMGPGGGMRVSPLKQALELALEIASHPISFIVYALIAAYALLWALLSGRTQRRRRVAHMSDFQPRPRSPTPAPEPVPGKARKRVRLRRRRHKTKPSTQRV